MKSKRRRIKRRGCTSFMILINLSVTSNNKLKRWLFIRFLTLRTPLRRPWGFCRWLNSIPSAPQNPYPSYPEYTNIQMVYLILNTICNPFLKNILFPSPREDKCNISSYVFFKFYPLRHTCRNSGGKKWKLELQMQVFFSLFQLCTQTLSNFPNSARFFLTRKNMIFKMGIMTVDV